MIHFLTRCSSFWNLLWCKSWILPLSRIFYCCKSLYSLHHLKKTSPEKNNFLKYSVLIIWYYMIIMKFFSRKVHNTFFFIIRENSIYINKSMCFVVMTIITIGICVDTRTIVSLKKIFVSSGIYFIQFLIKTRKNTTKHINMSEPAKRTAARLV